MYFLVIIVLTIIFIIMFPKKDTESFLKKPFIFHQKELKLGNFVELQNITRRIRQI